MVATAALLGPLTTQAYETSTHEILTSRAYFIANSFGGNQTVLDDLGLDSSALLPNSDGYGMAPEDILQFGAKWEDDRLHLSANVLTHFMDPQHGLRGLLGLPSSRNWALLDDNTNFVANPFSYRDAERSFVEALTLPSSRDRQKAFGLLFQTLGHVAHHIQDMAQPSHVRDDSHLTVKYVYQADLHHAWTAAKGSNLPTSGYTEPTIQWASDLWTSQGRGMAEFTALNFVSPDTTFRLSSPGRWERNPEFAMPIPDNSRFEIKSLGELVSNAVSNSSAQVRFIGNVVTDYIDSSFSDYNSRAASFSIFYEDLIRITPLPTTTFNRFNADAANTWLLPRAVAYSAALFDYFFRGRIEIVSSTFTETRATLTVRNASANDIAWKAQEAGQGDGFEWSVYYDTADGTRSRLPLTNDDLGDRTFAAGETYELSFPVPANVDRSKRTPFMLVFNGMIGNEAGIAARAFGEPGPAFLITPNYIPSDGIAGPRVIRWTGTRWELTQETGAVAGNVDWRGHLKGDVLTWDGPSNRYFLRWDQRSGISQNIYFDGRLLAQAPHRVFGAAIRTTFTGRELLVATYDSGQLHLYVRPFHSQYTNHGFYDAATNPTGWRTLYSGAHPSPASPMFFNASGTEGQMMAADYARRLKIAVGASSATVEALVTIGDGESVNTEKRVGLVETLPTGCRVGRTIHSELATVKEWKAPTVMCADYRGDVEVLCRIESEATIRRIVDAQQIFNPSTGSRRWTDVRDDMESSRRILVGGGQKLPLSGGTTRKNSSTLRTNPRLMDGSFRYDIDDFTVGLQYLDLRSSTLAYTETDEESVREVQVVGPTTASQTTFRDTATTTITRKRNHFASLRINGRQERSASRGSDAMREGPTITTQTNSPLLFDCSSGLSVSNGEQVLVHRSPFTDQFNGNSLPHSDSYDPLSASYATSASGHVIASESVRFPGDTAAYAQWNHLTGGHLETLVPGAPPDARYSPVKVLR